MQLAISFSVLFALLVALAGVEARPTKRGAGMTTLPLKRLHQARTDIHPQVYLQQHINRGLRRHARMTGRVQPSKRSLEDRLDTRVSATGATLVRRYRPASNDFRLKGGQQKSATGTQTGSGASASANASAEDGPGISQAEVNAANNGGLTPAETPSANNSIGLDIEANDVGYIGQIQMGTPPTNYLVLMDSGSADLWVASETCQTAAETTTTQRRRRRHHGTNNAAQATTAQATTGGCGNHTTLGSASSSTFVDTGKQFSVTYGTGQVSGTVVQDDINVAGLALTNHSFGVADTETSDFSDDTTLFDGLMGLAQSTLSEEGVPTPPESMASAGLISEAITSFRLGRVSDPTNDGEVTFGGLDDTRFDANSLVTFDNVNTEGFWEGAMTAVTANGQDLGLTGRTAILDTGTTLIIAPQADADTVHAAIPGAASDGQGGYTLPCLSNTSIALTFGGQAFPIDVQDLLFAPVDPDDLTGQCVSGISAGEVGGATEWLVGDVFLKNAYFSVNVGKNQISLATPV